MRKLEKYLGFLGLISGIVVVAVCLRWTFFYKFDLKYWENYYYESQWNVAQSKRIIPDEGVYRYVGYRLVEGENPFNIDYWVPPLGKYWYGVGAKYFGNPYLISWVVYLLSIGVVGWLANELIENRWGKWLAIYLFAFNPLIIDQIGQTMLDLPMTLWWLVNMVCIFKAKREGKWGWVIGAGVALGLMIGTKPGYFGVMIAIVEGWWLFKKYRKYWGYFWPTIIVGYLAAYSCYFIKHPNPIPFIRLHQKIIDFQKNNGGSHDWINILRVIFLDKYREFWEGGKTVILSTWSAVLPIGILTAGYKLVTGWRKKENDGRVVLVAGLVIGYVILNFFIDFYPRYLVPIIPLLVLLVGYIGQKKYWILGVMLVSYLPFLGNILFPGSDIFMGNFWEQNMNGFYKETYQMLDTTTKTRINENQWKMVSESANINSQIQIVKEHNQWRVNWRNK